MTKELFKKIGAALKADFLGQHVDAVERFDGDPENAVNEHVASLSDRHGKSILYGFEAFEVMSRDAAQWPKQIVYPVMIVLLTARRDGMEKDAEELDDLMDRVLDTFSIYNRNPTTFFGCQAIIPQPVSMTISDPDGVYLGRGIPFLFIKQHTPAGL